MFTKLTLVTILVGGSLYGASLAQTTAQDAACHEVNLTSKPGWTLSGGWRPDGTLVLVDALWNTLRRYSSTGVSLGQVGEPLKSSLLDLLPVTGQTSGSNFILQVSDGLMVLDQNLRPLRTVPVLASRGEDWTLDHYWQWQAVGTDIVAYGDVVHGTDRADRNNWRGALVRFPLQNPQDLQVLRLDDTEHRDRRIFFRSGNPYLASLGSTAYILSLGDRPTLYKHERGSPQPEELRGLVPGPATSPQLPGFRTGPDYVALMAAIEKESMQVGLYAWSNSLYILTRAPAGRNTRWVLTSIDPNRREITGSVELPIKANHVTVVPGKKSWAIIEKGPVKGYGVQEISRILFIPSAKLLAPLRSGVTVCSM